MAEAAAWYVKAADGGHEMARWMLGLMRIARKVGIDPFDPTRAFSPEQVIDAQAREMRRLLDKYHGKSVTGLIAFPDNRPPQLVKTNAHRVAQCEYLCWKLQ
jgi:hypothetical protein